MIKNPEAMGWARDIEPKEPKPTEKPASGVSKLSAALMLAVVAASIAQCQRDSVKSTMEGGSSHTASRSLN